MRKKLVALTIAAAFIGGFGLLAVPSPAYASHKTKICHFPPGLSAGFIGYVSSGSVADHIAHGDCSFPGNSISHGKKDDKGLPCTGCECKLL